jgi:hypothetical protein
MRNKDISASGKRNMLSLISKYPSIVQYNNEKTYIY